MFKFGPKPKTELDKAIDRVFLSMADVDPDTKEYAQMTKQLSKLIKLRAQAQRKLSPDTRAVVLGNLAGILMIVGHERAHVVTSRAINFVLKASR